VLTSGLSKLTCMRELGIKHCRRVRDDVRLSQCYQALARSLACMPQLERLMLPESPEFLHELACMGAWGASLSGTRALSDVDLGGSWADDEALRLLASGLAATTRLVHFVCCMTCQASATSQTALLAALSRHRGMTHLCLAHASLSKLRSDSQSWTTMLVAMPGLRHLNLRGNQLSSMCMFRIASCMAHMVTRVEMWGLHWQNLPRYRMWRIVDTVAQCNRAMRVSSGRDVAGLRLVLA
jgi:hypothetical protein